MSRNNHHSNVDRDFQSSSSRVPMVRKGISKVRTIPPISKSDAAEWAKANISGYA